MKLSRRTWSAIIVSAVVHGTLAVTLMHRAGMKRPEPPHTVHMHLTAIEHHAAPKVAAAPAPAPAPAPLPPPAPAPPPPAPAPVPKKVVKAKPKPVQVAEVPKPQPTPAPAPVVPKLAPVAKPAAAPPPVKPVLAKAPPPQQEDEENSVDSRGEQGEGSDETDGGDKSAVAMLLRATLIKPEYTTEALFARLEGLFPMNVKIDPTGKVLGAQMAKKVGFGMDERIVASVLKARFQPGRDEQGKTVGGWVKIKFKLEIPD